jgi:hypothetical protein
VRFSVARWVACLVFSRANLSPFSTLPPLFPLF